MNRYTVRTDEGASELLEVAAETELGYHVKVSALQGDEPAVYSDFIARLLFESLVKSGTLEPISTEARAG